MNKKLFLLVLSCILLFSQCIKKEVEPPTSTSTTPVFYFNGSINNSPVNLTAGVNNYYMNTAYGTDSTTGIFNYSGEFMTSGSSGRAANSLRITFIDYSTKGGSGDTLFQNGYYTYATPGGAPVAYSISFHAFSNQSATGYSWDFGDGTTEISTSSTVQHLYLHPGIYKVVLLATSYASLKSSDTNYAFIGQVGPLPEIAFDPNVDYHDTGRFSVSLPSNLTSLNFLWNFGDGTTSNLPVPLPHYFSPLGTGVFYVTLTMTDKLTNFSTKYAVNACIPTASGFGASFYSGYQTGNPNPQNLNDVIINWYDKNGTLWTSKNNNQHSNSLFQVDSVADYKQNTIGENTKILKANVSCELYNSAGTDSIPMTGNMVFGVAYNK